YSAILHMLVRKAQLDTPEKAFFASSHAPRMPGGGASVDGTESVTSAPAANAIRKAKKNMTIFILVLKLGKS
ncbi:hypothetical protein PFISCL1PPCAC_3817, partial [Pristionchus fissidentatus]